MRKMMKSIAAVLAVSALMVGTAFATDKLIVMGTDGTTPKVSINDTGFVTFPSPSGKGVSMSNVATTNNYGAIAVNADQTVPNAGMSLNIVPRGTGLNSNIKSLLTLFATDFIADSTNYAAMTWQAGATNYSFNSVGAGTGTAKPITFKMNNYAKIVYDTTGYVGINPSLTGFNVSVMPTHNLEVGNAVAGSGSGTVAIYPVVQTTAPAAGAAAALPTNPAGYFTITINGVDRQVAYY